MAETRIGVASPSARVAITPAQATTTPVAPGLVARVSAAVRLAITGKAPDWFGPGTPLPPAAPEDVKGRALDYPTAVNLNTRPRSYEAIDFGMLRALAEASDLVRLAVETRKDQLSRLPWTVKKEDATDDEGDGTAKKIRTFLDRPDGEHDFLDWMRLVHEDLLVLDAPAVYVHRTKGGQPFALEVIDGSTIARKIDARGRTPAPPDVAYQQVLKGLGAVDYTSDELLYKPRNVRPHKLYGYSPVEQIITTINIALRRQVHQLQAYTEGNIPDMLATVPTTWNPQQIAEFQAYWDELLAGDTAARRRVRFVPGEMKAERLNQAPLFDVADEWLARVVSYAFSLPPNAFVKQMNRATATSAQEVALEEGLAPLMLWTERFMTRLIRMAFPGAGDYVFAFVDDMDVDPEVQAAIDDKYVRMGVRAPADIAEDHGWKAPPAPPAPEAPGEPVYDPNGPASGAPAGGTGGKTPPPPPDDAKKLAKAVAAELDAARTARRRARERTY